MEYVKMKNLKKGQLVLVGEIGKGKFEVARLRDIGFHFEDWNEINMDEGIIREKSSGFGVISLNKLRGGMNVLNPTEIKEVEKIKNKIKMLENLKDEKRN